MAHNNNWIYMKDINIKAEIDRAFAETVSAFMTTPAIQSIRAGKLTLGGYKSILREIYHYTKEDPQIQAYASVYFRGEDRESVKLFLRHAISEIGHEKLALADAEALGDDVSGIEYTQPLPSTIAFTAFGFYQITFGNPVAYLGYLYFLEFLPTQQGGIFKDALLMAGIPESATTFLRDHMSVDIGHNQLMEKYLATLIRTRADLDAVIYTMRVSGVLYAHMLQGAIERADQPVDYGIAWAEVARLTDTNVA